MNYSQNAHQLFLAHADHARADGMQQYMRNQFDFLGIPSSERRRLTRLLWKDQGLPVIHQLSSDVENLWQLPARELQYLAMETCGKLADKVDESHIHTLEYMLTHKQWWDTVDFIAADLVGKQLKRFPSLANEYIPKWQDDSDLWLNRCAILFQLKYKEQTNTALLAEVILKHRHSKEFFIQKAIGWALRQYAKTNASWVRKFLKTYELAKLSKREASKHI